MGIQTEVAANVGSYNPAEVPGLSRFRVVITYDEVTGGEHGMGMFVRLRRDVGGTEDCHCDLWRFDLLGLPGVGEAAVLAGMNADMIIVAARKDTDLPTQVKSWLGQCLTVRTPGGKALVALLHSGRAVGESGSPARATLEMLARRYGLSFFAQDLSGPGGEPRLSIQGLRERLARASTKAGGNPTRRPRPARWGINE